jgi:hypothetical protein
MGQQRRRGEDGGYGDTGLCGEDKRLWRPGRQHEKRMDRELVILSFKYICYGSTFSWNIQVDNMIPLNVIFSTFNF